MAEEYGPWSGYQRVWFEYSVGPIGQGSTQVWVYVAANVQLADGASSSGSYAQSWWGTWGDGSQSPSYSFAGPESRQIAYAPVLINLTDAEQVFGFGATGRTYHGSASHVIYLAVPARYAVTPTVLTGTRVNDTQQNLSWSNNSTYTSVVVQRRVDDGQWQQVGTPSGNVTTWTDTTTSTGHKYEYRVAGVGGSGQSPWSSSVVVFTTPNAPATVVATKSGADIQVAVSGFPAYVDSYQIEDNGSIVASGVTSFPWTHISPSNSQTHTYRVRSVKSSLTGAWSPSSNTVALLAPPNAPSGLAPNGTTVGSFEPVVLSWVHSSVDTTVQSAYELQYRPVGGSWTTVSGTTAASKSLSLAEGSYEWQVRTRGQHPSYGPFSAVAAMTVIARPNVAITNPGSGTWDQAEITVAWSFVQAQSQPQSQWQLELRGVTNNLVESLEGSGAVTSAKLATRFANNTTWTIKVRAGAGAVWSAWATQTFTVGFVPPSLPSITAVWDDATGAMQLAAAASSTPGAPQTTTLRIERSVDRSATWEKVAIASAAVLNVSDFEALSAGETVYRVTAEATTGASVVVTVTAQANSEAVWLSGGAGFSRSARLPYEPQLTLTPSRVRKAESYEGRALPVAYAGANISRGVELRGELYEPAIDHASPDDLGLIVQLPEPVHLYRDPAGRRIYGALSGAQLVRGVNRIWRFSIELDETERPLR